MLVAASAAVILGVSLGASAQASAPAMTFQDEAAAIEWDLAVIAKSKGWTVAEARAQHEAGLRLDRVRDAVAFRLGESAVVGGMLAEEPLGVPSLLIKGTATAEVRQLAAASGVRILDGQPYTAAQLRKRASVVHDRLVGMGYPEVVTAVDIATAGVSATVTAQSGLPATGAALAASLPADLNDLGDGVALAVSGKPAVRRETAAFGGLRNRFNGAARCTSGWSVINSSGTTGVSTAAHCSVNQITHDGVNHPLALQAQHIGSQGDVEWGTTTFPEPDDFHPNGLVIRDVGAVEPIANITLNETICVYGRTTNAEECSTVDALDVTITDSLGTSKRLVAMGHVTQPGDSGGPWYNGVRAYGSHVGEASIDGEPRSVFQVADLYDEALAVRVRTT
ncbi:hypothetical protein Prum_005150 [Phytohabitans rumicis]|uniref:Serine protease n=2 Tax=Phytohabitans rumicis TaxID=1076125 RepID=A0A6V8KNY2_9ACTN|nr:hypothetical protein Prum_005150 [Phytohabitans rumicis]